LSSPELTPELLQKLLQDVVGVLDREQQRDVEWAQYLLNQLVEDLNGERITADEAKERMKRIERICDVSRLLELLK
jgi:hypothetical protein